MTSRITCYFSAHGGKFDSRNTSLILKEAADTFEYNVNYLVSP